MKPLLWVAVATARAQPSPALWAVLATARAQYEPTTPPTNMPTMPPSLTPRPTTAAAADTCRPEGVRRPFFFVVVADPQIGWNREGYDSEELFRVASAKVRGLESPPEFLVVLGDLIQNVGNTEEYETSKALLEAMGAPYHVLAGNHDVGIRESDWVPTVEYIDEFVELWEEPGLWYAFEAPLGNTSILMVDSNVLRSRDNPDASQDVVALAEAEMKWLEDTVASSTSAHVLVFLHHPLVVLKDDRQASYMPQPVRGELEQIFSENQVQYVFSGHFHRNSRVVDQVEYVTYGSTGVILGEDPKDPSGLAIVQVFEDRVEEQYYGYEAFPSVVEAADAGFVVTGPVGVLEAGSVVCITWTSTSMAAHLRIEYSLGEAWVEIVAENPNDGAYAWVVPNAPGSVTVRVVKAYQDMVLAGETEASIVGAEPSIQPMQRPTGQATATASSLVVDGLPQDNDDPSTASIDGTMLPVIAFLAVGLVGAAGVLLYVRSTRRGARRDARPPPVTEQDTKV